jgi:hypothetical protein
VIAGIGAELSVRTPPTQVSIETCKVVDTHGRPETGQNAAVTSLTLRHVARVARPPWTPAISLCASPHRRKEEVAPGVSLR